MKEYNYRALSSLSKTAYRSGILPVFLGLLVMFVDIINQDWDHLPTGLLIFILGYAFVKISSKINAVLRSEGEETTSD